MQQLLTRLYVVRLAEREKTSYNNVEANYLGPPQEHQA